MTLVELNNRKIELQQALSRIEQEIYDLRVTQSGIATNALVLYNNEVYKVVAHKFLSFSDKPWLDGVKKRKDGSFGTRHIHLYSDWSKL